MYNLKSFNDEIFNIIFVSPDTTPKQIIIKAKINELFLSLMRRYIQLTGSYNKKLWFLYNTRCLNPYSDLKQIGFRNLDKVQVLHSGNTNAGGGYCMNFTDLSKQIYEEVYFSNNAPPYRIAYQGINICGDCRYEKCCAYNNEVIIPLVGITNFNLTKEKGNLKCPICKSLIEPKTVLFSFCKYKVHGKNIEDNKVKEFEFFGDANNPNSFHYYNPIKNGETYVMELILEIINYYSKI